MIHQKYLLLSFQRPCGVHLIVLVVRVVKDLEVLSSIVYPIGDFMMQLLDQFHGELRTEQLDAVKIEERLELLRKCFDLLLFLHSELINKYGGEVPSHILRKAC